MFLRSTSRKKDGKSLLQRGGKPARGRHKTVQRTVLYLGEINDSEQASWRKHLEVFDEARQESRNLSLFPEDREIPADAVDGLQVRLSAMELRRHGPSATVGWPVNCGGNWGSPSFGRSGFLPGAKT